MKKIIFIGLILSLVYAFSARAEEVSRGVVARTDCDETQNLIGNLTAKETLTDAEAAQLERLQAAYRSDCSKTSSGRSRSGYTTVAQNIAASSAAVDDVDKDVVADVCSIPDVFGCCPGEEYTQLADDKFYCCPETGSVCFSPMVLVGTAEEVIEVEEIVPEKTEEEIAEEIIANLDAGLCGDGSEPNKYGCCGDETFKDMGNLNFYCCPADGSDCMPPIK